MQQPNLFPAPNKIRSLCQSVTKKKVHIKSQKPFWLIVVDHARKLLVITDRNLSGLVRGWSGWSIDHPKIWDVSIAKPLILVV